MNVLTTKKVEDHRAPAAELADVLAEARTLVSQPDADAIAALQARFDARLLHEARVHHVATLRLERMFDADGIKLGRLLLRTADVEKSAA